MIDEPATPNGVLTAGDVTALVNLVAGMLDRMESRILGRLDANSAGASERWAKHDAELATNTARVVKRFEEIESELLTVSNCLKGHLDAAHDAEVATDARVRPVKSVGRWVVVNWKSLALLVIAVLTALGILGVEWQAVR